MTVPTATHIADRPGPGDAFRTKCGLYKRADDPKVLPWADRQFATCRRCLESIAIVGLDEYQTATSATAIYPGTDLPRASVTERQRRGLPYLLIKLGSEAMEVGDKWAKHQRDGDGEMTPELRDEMVKELGDVLWYVAQVAVVLGVSLRDVAQGNLSKLASRALRGVLGGSGDNR